MATLTSPGVSVSVVNESTGSGSGQGTIPFILLATGQDKIISGSTEVAPGTLAENAGQVYLISSQRELLQTFGDPKFQSIGGTSLHGDPLNEYGLLAAHSYLGTANRVYVARVDVPMGELEPNISEPTSPMPSGTVWFDLGQTNFGLTQYNSATSSFDVVNIDHYFVSAPDNAVGDDGEYAIALIADSLTYYTRIAGVWAIISTGVFLADPVWPTIPAPSNDDYWLKTSPGNGGADYVFRVRNSLGQYVQAAMPVFVDDTVTPLTAEELADAYYLGSPAAGDFYVEFTDVDVSDASFFRHNGTIWESFVDAVGLDVEPASGPEDGMLWYNPDVGLDGTGLSTVDILVNDGLNHWLNIHLPGYLDSASMPVAGIKGDGASPILFVQPADPSLTETGLMDNDIWIDTDQASGYPVMYYWQALANSWVVIDTADQTTPHGVIFSDARPAPDFRRVTPFDATPPAAPSGVNNGGVASDPDLDLDAPDAGLYPKGFLLWNTRYSTRNVKRWNDSWLVFGDGTGAYDYDGRWVNASGNKADGSMLSGASAQRELVIEAMREFLVSNETIRAESIMFNLLAAPGFPELMGDMVTLNTDRKETAFIIGDTPMDLEANSTVLQQWLTNANGAAIDGPDGLITANSFLGVYYPSGLGVNVDGTEVVVPPSHMMLRVFGYNDQVAYPWFAPAGLSRGRITNASSVGYLNAEGEFVVTMLNLGLRDLLYENNVNPIAFITNQGITSYGQKTRGGTDSALDRINVARLVSHIRLAADRLAQPFLFEFNDTTTRSNVRTAFNRFLAEIATLRGLYDFLVVVDESNNTPARIDRNELWIDLVISPARTLEFIFIPIRIRNTGADLNDTVSQLTDRTNLNAL